MPTPTESGAPSPQTVYRRAEDKLAQQQFGGKSYAQLSPQDRQSVDLILQNVFGISPTGAPPPQNLDTAAPSGLAMIVPDLVAPIVSFVFATIGDFIKGFGGELLGEAARANQAYIIGIVVAVVVVFVLLG